MTVRNLSEFTFASKYAKYMPEENRRETWEECVKRSRDMMIRKYKDTPSVIPYIVRAYDDVKAKKCLGSQRALQFAGDPIFTHNARLYNCVASHCNRLPFFSEAFYLLLCGCGVGYSVQWQHVGDIPHMTVGYERQVVVVDDSIEGWADCVQYLLDYYFNGCMYPEFDFSRVRPKGAPLSAGGRAPGPEPLKRALERVETVLESRAEERYLRPIDCYDIVCHLADAVISGGVRRSATICVCSPDDTDMVKAKTGNWFKENPQRGRSNNSVLLVRGETTRDEFSKLFESIREFGEPGFVWADDKEMIVNPCVEIGMYPVTEDDVPGWQGCNLSTVNCSAVSDEFDFYSAVQSAAIIGTLQAGFTEFPYLGNATERIFRREALIGVSMTGVMDSPDIALNPEVQRKAAAVVVETNKLIADMIGINPAARTTCVKPEGTASCVLGTASGIHPHHAKRYIRRVQANKIDPVYRYYKDQNPDACEESVWSANGTDDVASFAIEAKAGAKTKRKTSAIELLQAVTSTQTNWVMPGNNRGLAVNKSITHNVSNTINVMPEEWGEVEEFIYDNRDNLCGVSLLSSTGDKDYAQAPFTAVYLPSQMLGHYGDAVLFVSPLIDFDNSGELWAFCDEVLMGFNKNLERHIEVKAFADKYLGGDLKRTTYLMKDVWNYELHTKLKASSVRVDYTQLIESEDNTVQQQEVACAGGSCDV